MIKRILGLVAFVAFCGVANAQILLQQSTATTVNFKLTKISDGTDDTGATVTSITLKIAKHSNTSSTSVTSATCAASGSSNDCVHVSQGLWNAELTAANTDTLGRLDVCAVYTGDYTDCTRYEVVAAASYDVNVNGNVSSASTLTSIDGRIPAALVSGRMDSSVGAIAANAITATSIASDAITAAKIADNAIDAATLATDTITAAKIAADAIGASEIADNAIDAGAIATDAITAAKIAANAIDAAEIASDVATEMQAGTATIKSGVAFPNYPIFLQDSTTGDGVPGLVAGDISCWLSKNGAAAAAVTDTSEDEVDSVRQPGVYVVDLSASETTARSAVLVCTGGSGVRPWISPFTPAQ